MKRKPKFEVYAAADGWRWRLKAANGRIIATGESHPRKADAIRACDTVVAACCEIPLPASVKVVER